jgi:hypothetical protein
MLLDANLLLYAGDRASPHHEQSADWLVRVLNGGRRVGIPWQTIGTYVRIATHPRIIDHPITPAEAWIRVSGWLAADPTWVPPATERTAAVFGRLLEDAPATGNLVPDLQLAALAVEHGLTVISADADFVRFPGVRWENPLV